MENNGHKSDELLYGLLEQTEQNWDHLREFFRGTRGFVPPAALGVASVARNRDDEIVGAVVLQMVSYMGPLKVRTDYARKVDYAKLKASIDATFSSERRGHLIIPGYVVLTSDDAVARIAQNAGMKPMNCHTLVQTFGDFLIEGV